LVGGHARTVGVVLATVDGPGFEPLSERLPAEPGARSVLRRGAANSRARPGKTHTQASPRHCRFEPGLGASAKPQDAVSDDPTEAPVRTGPVARPHVPGVRALRPMTALSPVLPAPLEPVSRPAWPRADIGLPYPSTPPGQSVRSPGCALTRRMSSQPAIPLLTRPGNVAPPRGGSGVQSSCPSSLLPVVARAGAILDEPPSALRSRLPSCETRGAICAPRIPKDHLSWRNASSVTGL
jgi:hypothetical protein